MKESVVEAPNSIPGLESSESLPELENHLSWVVGAAFAGVTEIEQNQ